MVIILKKSNKSGFVLLETLMALTVTVACIYLVSSSNRFLLQLDKQNNRRVLLVRRLYEDVKTFRKHQQLPSRTIVEPKSKTVIESNQNGIQQVKITQEEDTIEILQKETYLYTDRMSGFISCFKQYLPIDDFVDQSSKSSK